MTQPTPVQSGGRHEQPQPRPLIETRLFWLDLAERAGKTFVQNLVVAFAGGVAVTGGNWKQALSVAALAALVSVLIALVGTSLPTSHNVVVDLVERAGKTFLGSIVASLSVYTALGDVHWTTALSLALITTGASIVTTFGTQALTGSPSLVKGR